MKQLLLVLTAFVMLVSCRHITGSGNIVTEKRSTGSFTGISSSAGIDVEVRQGTDPEVVVEADDNIIKLVHTTVSGDVLKIGFESNTSISNSHVRVYVTAATIKSLDASSSAGIVVKGGIKSDGRLSFSASSSGSITAELDAPEVVAEANSSGEIVLTGKTRTYTAEVSSSGDLKTQGLLSENTVVSANSSGSASVHASVSLKANASSSGDIEYRGAASVEKTISSGGSIEKKD